jgi:Tol biopolymer transport system component
MLQLIVQRSVSLVLLVSAAACSGASGEGDPSGPPPPTTMLGSLRAVVQNPGLGSDADGYLLTLEGSGSQVVQSADTVIFADLAVGSHSLSLSDISANCRPPASVVRSPVVVAGQTTTEVFSVDCFRPFSDQIIYAGSSSIQFFALDASGRTTLIGPASPNPLSYPRPSPDGMHLAYMESNGSASRLVVADPDRKNGYALTAFVLNCFGEPGWRPDGHAIAYTCEGDLHVINVDGTGHVNLTNTSDGVEEHPAWSPDGAQIAFEGNNPGGGLFIMDADGANLRRLTTVSSDEDAAWSPSGDAIAFARWNGSTRQILTTSVDGSTITSVTPELITVDFAPMWSPDGSRIAFVRYLGQSYDLFSVTPTGTDLTRLTTGLIVRTPAWSR